MSKVFKVLSLSFLLCLSLVIAPFHISANSSLSAPFVGYNVYIYDFDSSTYVTAFDVDLDMTGLQFTCSNMQSSGGCMTYKQSGSAYDETGNITVNSSRTNSNTIYRADVILDNNYIGYVNITAGGSTKNWYVNGSMLSFSWSDGQSTSQIITINSYSLTLSSSNDSIMWMFPIESFPFIYQFFDNGVTMEDIVSNNNYMFPLFRTYNDNKIIFQVYIPNNVDVEMVCMITKYITASNFLTYFKTDHDSDLIVKKVELITSDFGTPNRNFRFCKVTFGNNASSQTFRFYAKESFLFVPIYLCRKDFQNISTDFALSFGLTNEMLTDLNIIANGTSSSVSSQSDLNQKTDDLSQSSNQLVTQEDTFNNDMNSALQNIDTNFNVGSNFGSKFIASADWVKTQYDRLTGNTPFGSVISFSLLIGLALLLVGKVFK